MLSPESPYPIAGGGALRTASLLEYLSRQYRVDLMVFRQPGAPHPLLQIPDGKVDRLVVFDLPPNGRGLAARAWRNAARMVREVPPLVDRFSGFEEHVRHATSGRRYEVGVIEHFWCARYVREMAEVCDRVVLDLHNIESVLHERCAAAEGSIEGLAHRVFQSASRRLEREWMPRFSEILTASTTDADLVRTLVSGAAVRVYPNTLRLEPIPERVEEDVVVFSGNMEYHPNFAAVRFFRQEIWPRLRERWPGLVWRLLGKNAASVKMFTFGDPRIDVVGEFDNAVTELARAKVAVVPLLAGSGTRLKILEAWAAGVPVVSTRVGAEGLSGQDGEHFLLADGAAPFTAAVSRLLASEALRTSVGMAGRLLLEKEFTWETAWQNLDF
jgi:glycosyltransferase involved in cell wall biosynthesis